MLISKNQYLKGFGITVLILALVRCVFPSIARPDHLATESLSDTIQQEDTSRQVLQAEVHNVSARQDTVQKKHPIYGVVSYHRAFPDSNDVQLASAQKYGVSPVANRDEAEDRKSELVYMGSSPFFHIDPLKSSIPYLVPRASVLLHDIGRNFFDSLRVKQIPLHQIIVTSILRSEEDVARLRQVNRNTSENSCHRYGTTFDISYNRYKTVSDPQGPRRREVQNDTLKWVLSEVLNDLRKDERCYVKYEVKQGCFHITVR